MTPALSIVVPCYNEAGNVPGLCERFRRVAGDLPVELILVDNGSTDQTRSILANELARAENHFIRSVRVPVNIGYGHGLQTGLRECQADVVAFTHADLQCPPADVIRAYSRYQQEAGRGPCLIKGRRQDTRALGDRIITWFYNHITRWVLGISADVNAEPKLFHRSLRDRLLAGPSDFTFDLFVLFKAKQTGCRIIEFDTVYEKRIWGRSKLAADPWIRFQTAVKAFAQIIRLRLKDEAYVGSGLS